MSKTFSNVAQKFTTDRPLGSAAPRQFDAAVISELEKKAKLKTVAVANIQPDPTQPRKMFDETLLTELAQDIQQRGVLQPILVYASRDAATDGATRYTLLAGERRWRAAKLANLESVPALVLPSEPDARERKLMQFAENEKRTGLNPVEEAEFFSTLLEGSSVGIRELARELAIDHTKISRALKLLRVPEPVRDAIREGKLKASHGHALADITDDNEQQERFNALLRGETTAAAIANASRPSAKPPKPNDTKTDVKTNKVKTIDGLTFTMTGPIRFSNKDIAERARKLAEKLDPSEKAA